MWKKPPKKDQTNKQTNPSPKKTTRKPIFPTENNSPTSADPGELADAFYQAL